MRLALFVVLLLVLVACDQAKDLEFVPTDPVEVAEETIVVEEKIVASTPSTELEGFCEAKPNFRATYRVKSVLQGEVSEGLQTVVVLGKDFKQETDTDSLFVLRKDVFVCQKDGSWECFNVPQEEDPEEPDCAVPDELSVEKIADKSIVGATARCFELTSGEEGVKDTHCFSNEGVLVYSLSEAAGNSVERTATYISLTVNANDLRLPSEPKSFEELMK